MADGTTAQPAKRREIVNAVLDSRRWNDFSFRDDDIVIATWAKSGTTLTQQIVAQLVLGGADDVYGQAVSPWLDFRFVPAADVLAMADAQKHRRLLKTHLPVDALVFDPRAKYVFIGRDVRDVYWSWHHHHSLFTEAAYAIMNPPDRTWQEFPRADPNIRRGYHEFLDRDGWPFIPFWSHVQSWWNIRGLPNVMLLHFNRLQSDLPGAVRDVAAFLRIEATDALVSKVLTHSTIDWMRQASKSFPYLEVVFEGGGANFINKGTNGRWRDVLSPEEVAKADHCAARNLTPDCAHWLKTGER
ncbi:MAG: sulfotransferase domain-containing protein [Parvularculaceae bacterium]|nr:sulfotransferase domain-containing protein [Parvularculaceae bacterium]